MMLPHYRCLYLFLCRNFYPYLLHNTCFFPEHVHWPAKTLYGTPTKNVSFPLPSLQDHSLPSKVNHSMDDNYCLSLGSLDPIHSLGSMRSNDALNNITNAFRGLAETDLEKALYLINHESLPFPSLFLLRDTIEKYKLFDELNIRNRIALSIVSEILTGKKDALSISCSYCDYIQTVHSVLKWILETGFIHDGLSNEYEQVLDITSLLLIKIYGDKTILPALVDTIFKRYTQGHFINDLVWAFFQAHDPNSLIFIAERLKSEDPKEVKLAHKLLSFCPTIDQNSSNAMKEQAYTAFMDWLKENSLFLYFTRESFQQATKPKPYVVILEAKYLYKTIDLLTGKTFEACTPKETLLLDAYNGLDMDTRILLANFSYQLHQKDIASWKVWIDYPIERQIAVAKAQMGVSS